MNPLHSHFIRVVNCFLLISILSGCGEKAMKQFTLMDPSATGVDFINRVEDNAVYNILSYEYAYNGGGIAAADFNNDGLTDLYFTANLESNKLYLNQGNLSFTDITSQAGVAGRKGWKTGVTTADVNSDGLLDLYVCYAGGGRDQDRANELYINQGGSVPTFVEQAREYGLDAIGTFSTQASFFDYDLDGDLDMFLLNHAKITYSPFYNTKKLRSLRHPRFGNRLYRNNGKVFEDVSDAAGIHGSGINFGLGISVSDLNQDGWPDLYVTNDYEEQDYCYLNNHDGTFRECLKESFRHISRYAMGSDIADFNNDALPDVFVVDMLPEDGRRQKLLKGVDEYDKYMLLRDSGYHHQNMRNMLQLNLGSDTNNVPAFSEIGQLSGVSNTDWSWSPLFVDLDNDGFKDLFVTNGYLRDFTNMDFLKYAFEDYKSKMKAAGKIFDTLSLIKDMPVTRLANYCFRNNHDLTFSNVSRDWGFEDENVSNGAVYADLDNDGDPEMIVNNMNEMASIYRNNGDSFQGNHFVKVRLKSDAKNNFAIGSRVTVVTKDSRQLQELYPTRGFQSSVGYDLLFGIGKNSGVEEIIVEWPDHKISKILNVNVDQTITVVDSQSENSQEQVVLQDSKIFERVDHDRQLKWRHKENEFVDYKYQFLLPYRLSSNGPCLAKADVNGDGDDDVFLGGARGQTSQLLLSNRRKGFVTSSSEIFEIDKESEDTGAAFFDADGDKDLDLYVVSGGAEFNQDDSQWLQDRLYINQGNGDFIKSTDGLPREKSNGSFVTASDFDHDGDIDLFIGGRTLPQYFPLPAYSYLLRNDSKSGSIKFSDITPEFLKRRLMLTCGTWSDVDNDGWEDLIMAGEFSPVTVVRNVGGKFSEAQTNDLKNSAGLWSSLVKTDLDRDGDEDLVVGNIGTNTQLKASTQAPLTLHYHDFNDDGRLDPILSYYINGVSSVYPSRDELLEQMPHLKKKFTSYGLYADAKLSDILNEQQLKQAKVLTVEQLQTCLFKNDGRGNFELSPLPVEAQFSRVNGIVAEDFNRDGNQDILLAGNFTSYRVQLGRSDASNGLLLMGTRDGGFSMVNPRASGFFADGDIRSMIAMRSGGKTLILCGVNDEYLKIFKVK